MKKCIFITFLLITGIYPKTEKKAEEIFLRAILNKELNIKGELSLSLREKDEYINVKYYQKGKEKRIDYPDFYLLFKGENVFKVKPQEKKATLLSKKEKINIELLFKNYNFKENGTEKINSFNCTKIALISKKTGKTATELWIYKEFPLVIKRRNFSREGIFLGESRFISIEWNATLSDSLFELKGFKIEEEKTIPCADKEILDNETGFKILYPTFLPGGFEINNMEVFKCPMGERIAHISYTDGIYYFSLFEHSTMCSYKMKRMKMPSCQCPKSEYQLTINEILFTLEGDLKKSEFHTILNNLKKISERDETFKEKNRFIY